MIFSINKKKNGDNDVIQISVEINDKIIYEKEFMKNKFIDSEIFSIVYLSLFKNKNDLKKIKFYSDEIVDSSSLLIQKINGAFHLEVDVNKYKKIFNSNKAPEKISDNYINDEIKYILNETFLEINSFYNKYLKKYTFSLEIHNKGNIVKNATLYSKYPSLYDNRLLNELNDFILEFTNNKNVNIFFKESNRNHFNNTISKSFSEKIEIIQNRKIKTKDDNYFNSNEIIQYYIENEISKEYKKLLSDVSQNESVVLFTDGGSNYIFDCSSYIISQNKQTKNASYLFNTADISYYEDMALLKGLEAVFQNSFDGKLYIVSDRENNYFIIESILEKKEFNLNESLINIYNDVCDLYEKNKNEIVFIPIKSHTYKKDFIFDGNRDVDANITNSIKYLSHNKSLINKNNDIINNNIISVSKDDIDYAINSSIDEEKENPYKIIMKPKNIKLSNMDRFKINILYIIHKEHNDENYCGLFYVIGGKKKFTKLINYTSIQHYSEQLDQIIFDIGNDKELKNLKILADNNSLHNANLELIINNSVLSKNILNTLISSSNIYAEPLSPTGRYFKDYKQLDFKELLNRIFNKKILGIKEIKENNNIIENGVQYLINNFEPQFDSKLFIGNESLFPCNDILNHKLEYLFITGENNKLKVSYISDGTEESVKIKNDEDSLFNINNFLANQSQKKGKKGNNGLVVIIPEKIIGEFNKAINGDGYYNCNILKIIKRKYKEPKLLVVAIEAMNFKIKSLKWYKEQFNENNDLHKKNSLKKRI